MIFPDGWKAEARLRPGKIRVLVPSIPPNCKCLNCGDLRTVSVLKIDGGPYNSVPQGGPAHYITDGLPTGWYTGTTESVPCPVCAGNKNEKFLLELSGLQDEELEWGFGNYWGKEGKDSAKRFMQGVAIDPKPAGFVTLFGDNGVGKTFLMKITVNELRQASVPAAYRSMAGILAEARETFDDEARRRETADSIIAHYAGVQALFIDEVDRVNLTPWAKEVVFGLLDTRYQRMKNRLTVLATNKAPDELPEVFKYLVSRMMEGLLMPVEGADMRLPHSQQAELLI